MSSDTVSVKVGRRKIDAATDQNLDLYTHI